MIKVRLILLTCLLTGLVSTSVAHTETNLASHAHLTGHLFEIAVVALVMLALLGGLRTWSKSRR